MGGPTSSSGGPVFHLEIAKSVTITERCLYLGNALPLTSAKYSQINFQASCKMMSQPSVLAG